MKTEQPILITSKKCNQSLGITKYRFVLFGGTWGSEGVKSLGVCNADTSLNEQMPVTVKGIALVITGGGIPLGIAVQAFDEGVAAVQDGGPLEGYAMDTASGAGQLIRVLLVNVQNEKYKIIFFIVNFTPACRECCKSQICVISTEGRNLFRGIIERFLSRRLLRNDSFGVLQQTLSAGRMVSRIYLYNSLTNYFGVLCFKYFVFYCLETHKVIKR